MGIHKEILAKHSPRDLSQRRNCFLMLLVCRRQQVENIRDDINNSETMQKNLKPLI